ncbi:MAG: cytochrome c peroxidase [Elainellaceae cyanobacterium]
MKANRTLRRWLKRLKLVPVLLFCLMVAVLWQQSQRQAPLSEALDSVVEVRQVVAEPIQPLPKTVDLNPKVVALGQQLFHEPDLSRDRTLSCASCHALDNGGIDGKNHPVTFDDPKSSINTPTVFNSSFNFRQFWDGRTQSLEAQVDVPLQDPQEMNFTWPEAIARLQAMPNYSAQFTALYPDGITPDTVRTAIATYERSLITPNAPFDRYLLGDKSALTANQMEGYQRFKANGCISCHQGVNVGGNMFQVFGVFGNYFEDRGELNPVDLGRYNITHDPNDRYVFKVPSLRNVEQTAPYFHDGSIANLQEAVAIMGRYQLGRSLSEDDQNLIVEFLRSLTGEPHQEGA